MDAHGFATPAQVAGKRNAGVYWQGTSIKKILQNPHYVGDMVQGRSQTRSVTSKKRETLPEDQWVIVPDTHEPIISRDDFEAVQALMKSRYVKRTKAQKHLFTNFVYCADCGASLWYLQNRKGYVCGRFKKHGKHACTSHIIKEELLKRLVIHDLKEIVKKGMDKEFLLSQIESNMQKASLDQEKRLHKIEKEIEKLKAENRKYLKLLADEPITKEDYKEVSEYNRRKVEQLQTEIVVAKQTVLQQSKQKDSMLKLAKELEKVLEFDDLTDELLTRMVDRIDVEENQQITIHYRFAAPLLIAG